MVKDFTPYSNLWITTKVWFEKHKLWLTQPWEELNALELEDITLNSFKTMQKTLSYFKARDFPKITAIAQHMKDEIDKFRPVVPVAVSLRKDGMYDRHWQQLSENIQKESKDPTFKVYPEPGFTLTNAIEKGLCNYTTICEEVGDRASREYAIEQTLNRMKKDWTGVEFQLPQFKSTTTSYISGFDDAMNMLDEHILTTQAMGFSPFRGPFEQDINEWNNKLLLVANTLEEWVKCQGQWMYLQPIFDSPDII